MKVIVANATQLAIGRFPDSVANGKIHIFYDVACVG